jgi:hypothetical protein
MAVASPITMRTGGGNKGGPDVPLGSKVGLRDGLPKVRFRLSNAVQIADQMLWKKSASGLSRGWLLEAFST